MIDQEMTAGSVADKRELTVEELDAITGGVLPEGFAQAIGFGIMLGIIEAGGRLS